MRFERRASARRLLACSWLVCAVFTGSQRAAAEMGPEPGAFPLAWQVHDTLDPVRSGQDPDPAAAAMLSDLLWEPQAFTVHVQPPKGDETRRLFFPSPRPSGNVRQDQAVLRWYAPPAPMLADAPGILILHSLHPDLVLATMLARGLAARGCHVFILEMPGFGERNPGPHWDLGTTALIHGRQTVADARRARDVVATAPGVAGGAPGLVGISLGGFPAAVVGAMDPGLFSGVYLLISGSDAMRVLEEGRYDAAALARAMAARGYDHLALAQLLAQVEPLTVAHRLDGQRTWLFSARGDHTVPAATAERLARQIGLPLDHHHQVPGNHYTAVLHWPQWTARLAALHHAANASVQP